MGLTKVSTCYDGNENQMRENMQQVSTAQGTT